MTISDLDQKRLAEIRMHNAIASAHMDTSNWESTFFLKIIDRLIGESK